MCVRKTSPSRGKDVPPTPPSAKPDAPSASSSPFRRTGTGSDASSDRPTTPEYWDVDEAASERQSSTADAVAAADDPSPGRTATIEWLPEMIVLGDDAKLQRHLAESAANCDVAASYTTTTAGGHS